MDGILNDQYSHNLANWINNIQVIEHQERMNLITAEQDLAFIKAYNLIPFKDGDQWCVLLGADLQSGIAGFGDTPLKAILDFNKSFTSK